MSTTNPQDTETEWDILQRKFGNLPPKPATETEEAKTRKVVEQLEQIDPLATKTLRELSDLEDEVAEDTLEKYRKKRLEELRRKQKRERFGTLEQLGKDEFVQEVTEASAVDPDAPAAAAATAAAAAAAAADDDEEEEETQQQQQEKGTWVVLHLYQDSVISCRLLNECLSRVAARNKSVKFLKAASTDVIANYPNNRLPTVLLYFGGVCKRQVLGADEWGGNSMCIKSVEAALRRFKVLERERDLDDDEAGDESEDDQREQERDRIRSKGYSSTTLDAMLGNRF